MPQKEDITTLFDTIAPQYDNLNHILSLGIDKWWRKKAIKTLKINKEVHLLDIACGTGDFSIAAVKHGISQVTGIDISKGMIEVGQKKIEQKKLNECIKLLLGDCENMQFEDEYFDAASIAFGIRNFENPSKALTEILRVLKKNGQLTILEFSVPPSRFFRSLYYFYFRKILPFIGGIVSGNKTAYQYLPQSVIDFPHGEEFRQIMRSAGFTDVKSKRLTMGIATIYTGKKP